MAAIPEVIFLVRVERDDYTSIIVEIGDTFIGHVVEFPFSFLIIFIGASWVLINSFLFSRSSNKASTSGIIKPMMLTQIGMINPPIRISTWKIILTKCAADIAMSRIATMVIKGFMIRSLRFKSFRSGQVW